MKLKNLIRNFKYMSFSELRLFYVILVGILVTLTWFFVSITQSKSDAAVNKIARVNQELVKLTQKSTDTKKDVPLLNDAKVTTGYTKDSPQQRLREAIKTALDYPDAKTLLERFNANKDKITGSIWSINAPNNAFTTDDWQAQANLGDWSQSVTNSDVVPNADGTYTAVITIQPLGDKRESKQPQSYWLTIKLSDTVSEINVNGQLESYR